MVLSVLAGLGASAAREVAAPTPAAAYSPCLDGPYACWMGTNQLSIGDRPLNQVIQPFSHDTGTYNIHNYATHARNQDHNVFQQLDGGIRGFDIRVQPRTIHGKTELYAYHGSVSTDVLLSAMLNDAVRFSTGGGGVDKEIIYLHIDSRDADDESPSVPRSPGLSAATCRAFEPVFRSLALSPAAAKSPTGAWLSMNEIWAKPGSPRFILDWAACNGVSPFWNEQNWQGTNLSYYARQKGTPCVRHAVLIALTDRRTTGGTPIPDQYVDGQFCGGFAALGGSVSGLYTLYLQQTGLVPASALYVQRDVLSAVIDAFINNRNNARANLNYLGADFAVNDANGTNLTPRVVGMNLRSALPVVALTVPTDGSDVTARCATDSTKYPITSMTVTGLDDSSRVTYSLRANNTVSFSAGSALIVHCTDSSGRKARRVYHNTLTPLGTVHEEVFDDAIGPAEERSVLLTDADGKPLVGKDVLFSVAGPATVGRNQTQFSTVTNAQGIATVQVTLAPRPGSVTLDARSSVTNKSAIWTFLVRTGAVYRVVKISGDGRPSGDGQTAAPNAVFAAPLRIGVRDKLGYSFRHYPVALKIVSGSAVLGNGATSATLLTDDRGNLSFDVRAGATRGPVVVSATSGGMSTTFNLTVA